MIPLNIASRESTTRKIFAFCYNDLKSGGLVVFGGVGGEFCLRHNIHSIELETHTSSWPLWASGAFKATG